MTSKTEREKPLTSTRFETKPNEHENKQEIRNSEDIFDELKKSNVNQISSEKICKKPEVVDLSPIKKFKPNPEWSNLNVSNLSHLKKKSANFRTILDELKRAK